MSEDPAEIHDDREDWRHHPHTAALRRETKGQLDDAFKKLARKCQESADANVRQAYVEYELTKRVLSMLNGKEGGA